MRIFSEFNKQARNIVNNYNDNREGTRNKYKKIVEKLIAKIVKPFSKSIKRYSHDTRDNIRKQYKSTLQQTQELLRTLIECFQIKNVYACYLFDEFNEDYGQNINYVKKVQSLFNNESQELCLGCRKQFFENQVIHFDCNYGLVSLLPSEEASYDRIAKQVAAIFNEGGGYILIAQRVNRSQMKILKGKKVKGKQYLTNIKNQVQKFLFGPKTFNLSVQFIPIYESPQNKNTHDKVIRLSIGIQKDLNHCFVERPAKNYKYYKYDFKLNKAVIVDGIQFYHCLQNRVIPKKSRHYNFSCAKSQNLEEKQEKNKIPIVIYTKQQQQMMQWKDLQQLRKHRSSSKFKNFVLVEQIMPKNTLQLFKQKLTEKKITIQVKLLFPSMYKQQNEYPEIKRRKVYMIEYESSQQQIVSIGRDVRQEGSMSDRPDYYVKQKIKLSKIMSESTFGIYINKMNFLFQGQNFPFFHYFPGTQQINNFMYEQTEFNFHSPETRQMQFIYTFIFFCLKGYKPSPLGQAQNKKTNNK